jgi:hypothetical protein
MGEKHLQRCQREATRDVIFLFQVRVLKWTGLVPDDCEFEMEDCHVWRKGADRDKDSPVSLAELHEIDSDYAVESWRTIGVWLDREEAESWGESQHYNYGEKYDQVKVQDRCWQVYGTCAEGQLAELLRNTADTQVQPAVAESLRLTEEALETV